MSEVTLSLGGKWNQAAAEREKQQQIIAHLTNQLEGLKQQYQEDIYIIQHNKQLLQQATAEVETEKQKVEEWRKKYEEEAQRRKEVQGIKHLNNNLIA